MRTSMVGPFLSTKRRRTDTKASGSAASVLRTVGLRGEITVVSGARLPPPLLHDGFQVIEVALKRLATLASQLTARLRPPADELLVDGDIAFFFELLQVDAQVAIGHLQSIPQLGERQTRRGGQRRDNGQPTPLVQNGVQLFDETFEGFHRGRSSEDPRD